MKACGFIDVTPIFKRMCSISEFLCKALFAKANTLNHLSLDWNTNFVEKLIEVVTPTFVAVREQERLEGKFNCECQADNPWDQRVPLASRSR